MKFKRSTNRSPMFNLFCKNSDLISTGIKCHMLVSKLERLDFILFRLLKFWGCCLVLKICFTKSGQGSYFDCKFLLKVLIGFSEETTKWFKFYLSNRKFKVYSKIIISEPGILLCSVSQGSNLAAPHLFLLYVNDMLQSVDYQLLLYADDTCLIFQLKYFTEIEMALSKDFSICDWFVDN